MYSNLLAAFATGGKLKASSLCCTCVPRTTHSTVPLQAAADKNDKSDGHCSVNGNNGAYIENLYKKWQLSPTLVDNSWHSFFSRIKVDKYGNFSNYVADLYRKWMKDPTLVEPYWHAYFSSGYGCRNAKDSAGKDSVPDTSEKRQNLEEYAESVATELAERNWHSQTTKKEPLKAEGAKTAMQPEKAIATLHVQAVEPRQEAVDDGPKPYSFYKGTIYDYFARAALCQTDNKDDVKGSTTQFVPGEVILETKRAVPSAEEARSQTFLVEEINEFDEEETGSEESEAEENDEENKITSEELEDDIIFKNESEITSKLDEKPQAHNESETEPTEDCNSTHSSKECIKEVVKDVVQSQETAMIDDIKDFEIFPTQHCANKPDDESEKKERTFHGKIDISNQSETIEEAKPPADDKTTSPTSLLGFNFPPASAMAQKLQKHKIELDKKSTINAEKKVFSLGLDDFIHATKDRHGREGSDAKTTKSGLIRDINGLESLTKLKNNNKFAKNNEDSKLPSSMPHDVQKDFIEKFILDLIRGMSPQVAPSEKNAKADNAKQTPVTKEAKSGDNKENKQDQMVDEKDKPKPDSTTGTQRFSSEKEDSDIHALKANKALKDLRELLFKTVNEVEEEFIPTKDHPSTKIDVTDESETQGTFWLKPSAEFFNENEADDVSETTEPTSDSKIYNELPKDEIAKIFKKQGTAVADTNETKPNPKLSK